MNRAQHIRRRFARGSFGGNVLTMLLGTAIGQLGSVLSAPLLARLYGPEGFGILGAFAAFLGIFSSFASLRYEMALPLAENEDDAADLLAVCGVTLGLMTALLACADHEIGGMLAPYRFLLPLGFLGIGGYQIMVCLATREQAFRTLARTKISQGIAGPLTQIGLGFLGTGAWGLLVGFIVGQSAGTLLLFSKLVTGPQDRLGRVSWAGMRRMAFRFRRFPLFSSWSGFINAAGTNSVLMLVIPFLYSGHVTGFLFLVDRVVGRPLLLVSTSILQVYIGDAARSLHTDPARLRLRFLRLAAMQLGLVSTWLLLVNGAANWAFPRLFGPEWAEAVPYLRVLSLCYLPLMVMHALAHTLQILEKLSLSAAWECARLIAVLAVFAAAYAFHWDALTALLAYSLCQAAAQCVLFFLMLREITLLQKPLPESGTSVI